MARNAPVPTLGWIDYLYEVGSALTRYMQEEADVLADIAKLEAQVSARKRDLAAVRAKAEERAAALWTEDEIAEAKSRARAEVAA